MIARIRGGVPTEINDILTVIEAHALVRQTPRGPASGRTNAGNLRRRNPRYEPRLSDARRPADVNDHAAARSSI